MAAASNTNSNDLKEAKALLQELNMLKRKLNETPFTFTDTELLKQFKDLPGYIDKSRKQLEGMSDSMSGLYGSLRGITSEFKGQATVLNKVRGAFRQLEDIAQDLKFDEQEINDLNASQLKKLEQKFKRNQQILGQEARALINQNDYAKVLSKSVQDLTQQGKTQDEINEHVSTYLKNTTQLSDEHKALLQLYYDQGNTVDEINKKISDRIQKEKEINNALGVGGAAVQGISTLMGKLGMSSGIFSDAVQEAEEAMRNAAKDGGSKMQVLMAGLGPLAKGFGKALLDPLTIVNAIVDGFLEVNKAAVNYQRLTGQNATAMAGMNDSLATSAQVLELMAELTTQTGIAAGAIFSPEDLGRLAEAQNLLGLSAEQAGNLGIRSKLAGKSIESYEEGIVKSTNNYNALNNTAISHGVVMQDVLNTSDDIALSLGNSDEAITKAAASARGLGLSLEKVDDIANSLMDFETSIGYELEAQLLTGKDINLAKAREYAMTNNLAGLSEELKNNGASAAEFANMNRYAQEGLAKALGMSRTELAKSIMMQETAKNLTDDERAAAMGVSVEQLKQMDIQTKIQTSLAKLAQAFAPILDVVVSLVDVLMLVITPVAKLIAMVVGNPIGKYLLLAVVAANFLGVAVSGVGKAFGSMYKLGAQAVTGLIGLFKQGGLSSALGGLGDKLKGGFGVGSGSMVQAKSGKFYGKDSPQGKMITNMKSKTPDIPVDKADSVAGGADKAGKSGNAEGFKEKMQNIAEGLKAFGNTKVLFGAFNLIPSSIGLIAMIPGVLGAKAIEQINGEKFQESMYGLAYGIEAMGKGKVFLGSLGLIAASVGLLVMIPGVLGAKAIEQINGKKFQESMYGLAYGIEAMGKGKVFLGSLGLIAASVGLVAMIPGVLGGLMLAAAATPIATGLNILGGALVSFGTLMATGVGLLGLGALIGSAVLLGVALNLAAPGIEAFGTVITAVFAGIATVIPVIVDGFVTLISSLAGSIGPMLLLGPALFGIAAGLAAIALAGPMAIPALIAVTGLAAVAGGVLSIFGGGEGDSIGKSKGKADEGSMAIVAQKLDVLIELTKRGTSVKLDGKVLATSNTNNQKQVGSNLG